MTLDPVKDFFISYNKADRAWAEWIAWTLEEAGITTHLQAWDFRPGVNFVLAMHEAIQTTKRVIAVLSPAYLAHAPYSAAEWAAAFVQDPTGANKTLLTVRVQACNPTGLLASIIYIDIVGCDEVSAADRLLAGIDPKRAKPTTAPAYPGKVLLAAGPGPSYPANWPAVWTVPAARNPFFSGRDELLLHLHERLLTSKATALTQAISGLGGIGKTQTAIEYAYRYEHAYRYVLWVSAATSEAMLNDCIEIAARLHLSAFDAHDQRTLIPALQQWLTQQRHWLLILDNADDLALVRSFLPPRPNTDGHILLTTRAQATGAIAQPVAVEKMDQDEGTLLLLRRTSLIAADELPIQATDEIRNTAKTIVSMLDGLPLALDQAGGYIEETGCTLQDYVHLYQEHRRDLLHWHSQLSSPYPATVATTWSLAFQRIEQTNPAAVALLQFCAFLAPDAIPEAIITEAATDPSGIAVPIPTNAFDRNAAFELLRRYSLVRRHAETKTLSIHRLVQIVLQDTLSPEIQHVWAACVINTIYRLFAHTEPSPALEPYVPHAYVCLEMIERYALIMPTSAQLLQDTGNYLLQYARYKEAEAFYRKALTMLEQLHGHEHLVLASPLYSIGQLYYFQDRYDEAEEHYRQALALYTKSRDKQGLVTKVWHALGRLYYCQGLYLQAEDAYRKTLSYYAKNLTEDQMLDISIPLYELAMLYEGQGKYLQAEEIFEVVKSTTKIKPSLMMNDEASVQVVLAVLVKHHRDRGEYEEIEVLYQELLDTSKKQLGAEHPTTAAILHELAWYRRWEGNNKEAEALYEQALNIREKVLGNEHTTTAKALLYLGMLKRELGKDNEAEILYQRALGIYEKVLGSESQFTGSTLQLLAQLKEDQGQIEEAYRLYQRALSIEEKTVGSEHEDITIRLHALARLGEEQGKFDDAEFYYKRELEITEKILGNEHQSTVATLHHLALLYQKQEKYDIAKTFYQRTVNAGEKALGIEHSYTIRAIKDYVAFLRMMGRESEALELEARIKVVD